MLLRIEVTEEDCLTGERGSYVGCPVALALSRATGRPTEVSWWGWCLLPDHPGVPVEGLLPSATIRAIVAFDASGIMSPFAFDLDIPEGA